MSDLQAFYAQNVASDETEEFIVSKRFKDAEGNPIPWVLRVMTEGENEEIRKSATKMTGKKGLAIPQTDTNEYLIKLAVASVVHPNLKDADLQKSYNVLGAPDLLRKMLRPGEYAALVQEIQELNGFSQDLNGLIDEAKN